MIMKLVNRKEARSLNVPKTELELISTYEVTGRSRVTVVKLVRLNNMSAVGSILEWRLMDKS